MSKLTKSQTKSELLPWRSVKFKPARPKAGLDGGGTVYAEVFLGETWHAVKFTMDREGFLRMAELSPERRYRMLDALALVPIRNDWLRRDGKKRARGRHTEAKAVAWSVARYLAPSLLQWAEQVRQSRDPLYAKVVRRMTRGGLSDTSALAVATWLIEEGWRVTRKARCLPISWPKEWPDVRPTANPREFVKRLRKAHSSRPDWMSPDNLKAIVDDLVDDLLAGRPGEVGLLYTACILKEDNMCTADPSMIQIPSF